MKRIVEAVAVVTKFFIFMAGFILCMSETSELTNQICVSLAGMELMIIVVLPTILRDWRATWRTS